MSKTLLDEFDRVIMFWLLGQNFHQTSPCLNWLELEICVKKIQEISGNFDFCFDFGCQVIFYQIFASFSNHWHFYRKT